MLFTIDHLRSISFFCQNAHHDWVTKDYISNWFLVDAIFKLFNQNQLPKLFEFIVYIFRAKPLIQHLFLHSCKLNISLIGFFLCTSKFLPIGFRHQLIGLNGCGMGPWLVPVSPCFGENIVATRGLKTPLDPTHTTIVQTNPYPSVFHKQVKRKSLIFIR